ncbi:MAG TPA: succinate dehydrogenase [Algoriphagus sp.]|jgi:succinate dehydrogenase / fumarate reductase cytochrome b subunit|uniref:succinate dehydrogenase cytochrome b subunit n=2 Tax=Algoriphagus TaxID=246875 RepID=UPI000C4C6A32|nr:MULTISPECIES: succinate dehydrogenase cytochrome b subunit [unclassified Algoriphagus]MAL15074.1 succinate dehydrogenase [Algoriphagus sp.]MAN87838.1 succinate dehydrogenase [Algoriphagus sp.]QYH39711.1 succinate dehydrogenase cytochrome b subunit [Algoriphagus sp. NBT04N3]HAD51920.1 succinate dehydrogenase [Algoriphagus sp.]HAH36841.1 succinate dehydrogenase [Algoriphagus sp.]|tara:strand:+ start:523 stop:1203 length:681 start_codon:yes stop_codon:yes gene_type:complete
MSWVTKTLSSTLGRKLIMGLTGLFLILFLTGHVSGNLLLFKGDDGQAFNIYAKFMTTNPAVKILSYLTYISIIGHVVWSIWLTRQNKAARPVGYAVSKASTNSTWSSRNMGILGTIILIFLVVHLQGFWYEMHWGNVPTVTYEGEEYKDLFSIVTFAFQNELLVAGYVIAMGFLGFHLSHGFASAFQTLGLSHKKYSPAIETVGKIYCVVVPAVFASMPLYIYFTS